MPLKLDHRTVSHASLLREKPEVSKDLTVLQGLAGPMQERAGARFRVPDGGSARLLLHSHRLGDRHEDSGVLGEALFHSVPGDRAEDSQAYGADGSASGRLAKITSWKRRLVPIGT
ncbi:hypothetical protein GCM10010353_51210 [Streptomyces chryseus]|nr:hypothetical protein GCM10010353_51210 [Streptomyces chryseus]